MNILLRHFEDHLRPSQKDPPWDLMIDLGRVPNTSAGARSTDFSCPLISLYEFAEEVEDLRHLRSLVQFGTNRLVDQAGIDWWSVLSSEILPELQQIVLVHRLARYVNQPADIYTSRSDYRCIALHKFLGGRLIVRDGVFQNGVRHFDHYAEMITKFGLKDIFQIAQDKFDSQHSIRRRFARRNVSSDDPVILLPSAYINVSRTALTYAAQLPEERFLLVCTRNSARVQELPGNVDMISLDSYFAPPNPNENESLLERWENLRIRLVESAPEFEFGAASGLFDRLPRLLTWGIVIRDAWARLFRFHNFRSCFCADHTNTYTRIPLLLAKQAGSSAIVCHHGALDWGMAITSHDADCYIAKSAMEHDYMERVCGIEAAKILDVPQPAPKRLDADVSDAQVKPWLVFFSEPYELWSWRPDEAYKELLPHLCWLAEQQGLKLVFKLHPFESPSSQRKLLLRHLSLQKAREIKILTGPITEEVWQKTSIAFTAQSSVALECAARGIPIFLCAWLRDSFSGYVEQYQRFGVGYRLETPDRISEIPQLLTMLPPKHAEGPSFPCATAIEALKEMLTSAHPLSTAAQL